MFIETVSCKGSGANEITCQLSLLLGALVLQCLVAKHLNLNVVCRLIEYLLICLVHGPLPGGARILTTGSWT